MVTETGWDRCHVDLDLQNYADVVGDDMMIDRVEVARMTDGLHLTFNLDDDRNEYGGTMTVRFTGCYLPLVLLIERYEEDLELRSELIESIVDDPRAIAWMNHEDGV